MSVLEQSTSQEKEKKWSKKWSIGQSWFGWTKYFRKAITIKIKYRYWRSDFLFVGFLEDYPDYWTQGETLQELKEHLVDIYMEVNNPESLGANSVHDKLPNDDVPSAHKTDALVLTLRVQVHEKS